MKPLVRWTIGNTTAEGIDALQLSVSKWQSVYKNRFDMVICHNNLPPGSLVRVRSIGISTIDQENYVTSLKSSPRLTAWKLCPPRLRLNAHEIFLDNDLIVYERSESIERFLDSTKTCIITSAYKPFYGQYRHLVPEWLVINSGLFGLPPGYDLREKLDMFACLYGFTGWREHCDDEGALAFLLSKQILHVIPMQEIAVCNPNVKFAPYRLGQSGVHFVSMNQGSLEYWNRFRKENDETTSTVDHRSSHTNG